MTAVKTTSLIEKAIALLAPHHCYGCSIEESLLCEACQESVVINDALHCIDCRNPTSAGQGLCKKCLIKSPLAAVYVAGRYETELERLIHDYKFARARAAHAPLAQLLHNALPYLARPLVIVPLPTISAHIRERGYDHTKLLARDLARLLEVQWLPLLKRRHNLRQVGASRQIRIKQARTAYTLSPKFPIPTDVLLVDDVVTSGESLRAAARLLKEAGVERVTAVVVAQQQ